jgi:hypothetical protein
MKTRRKQQTECDIVKVAAYATPFGTGCHVVLPRDWLSKRIISVTEEKWDEIQGVLNTIGTPHKIQGQPK